MSLAPLALAILLVACSDGSRTESDSASGSAAGGGGSAPVPGPCDAGELPIEGGGCLAAGMQENGCAAGEVAVESGGCRSPGIAAEMCGDGFVAEADGCRVVLPDEPCPLGLVTLPGEMRCRELAPCGSNRWGSIPIEADTQHVDGSYGGPKSDGTPDRPWTSLQAAIDAAAPGAIVAVAAGSYVESLSIQGKPVRVWGRCPALVEIVGANSWMFNGAPLTSAVVVASADGTEIRSLAVRGDTNGIGVADSVDVVIDRVWIHETLGRGLEIGGTGPTRVVVTGSLVERAGSLGAIVVGSEATFEASVVRGAHRKEFDGFPGPGATAGVIFQQDPSTGKRATGMIRGTLVEQNEGMGVLVLGAEAIVESSIVRATQPQAADQTSGYGIGVLDSPLDAQRGALTLRASVLQRNRGAGLVVSGSDATIEEAVVRDTLPQASDQDYGWGVSIQVNEASGQRAKAELRSSLVESNRGLGVNVGNADAMIDASIVRHNEPRASDQELGWGIQISNDPDPSNEPPLTTVRATIIEGNRDVGIFASAGNVALEGVLVRNTQPRAYDSSGGWGIDLQCQLGTPACSNATIRSSRVEGAREFGVVVLGSRATLEATLVQNTEPAVSNDGFGDGVLAAMSEFGEAVAILRGVRIEASVRVGVSSFGAHVAMANTLLECNLIDLDGEMLNGIASVWEDLGGDVCGCAGANIPCRVSSASFGPPEPLPPVEPPPSGDLSR